jgi:hypothetical protein
MSFTALIGTLPNSIYVIILIPPFQRQFQSNAIGLDCQGVSLSGDHVVFRDVEQAFVLASSDSSEPAVILAGGVIEELLRLHLKHTKINPIKDDFDGYIQTHEQNKLLKARIFRLSDSVMHFRNLVHLSKEQTARHSISKSTAKGAAVSIFTIANDL